MRITEIFKDKATQQTDDAAILGLDNIQVTYGALWEQIQYMGSALNAFGLHSQDRVAVVLPNGPAMAMTFLSISGFCAIAPLNPQYREPEFEFYLSDLQAKLLIIQAGMESPAIEVADKLSIPIAYLNMSTEGETRFDNLPAVTTEYEPSAESDVALVLHTSGTTSRPKMVPLTQKNIITSALNVGNTLALSPQDRCLNVMPLFHIHGLIGVLLSSMLAGASVACTTGYFAPEFFNWLKLFKPTWYSAVPTMHQGVVQWSKESSEILEEVRLRFIRSSSSSLPPSVMEALEDIFKAPVIESYGMTEAAHQMSSNPLPPRQRKPGAVGPPAGPEMSIMDDSGNILPDEEIGEIIIKGENVTAGYAQNQQANEEAFKNGWFRTGDQGYRDQDGYYYITGRIKEIINRAGEKVSPREIDEILLQHQAVRQATAFAIPHGILGEEIGVAVVLEPGEDLSEIAVKEYLSSRLADFKVPRVVQFVTEIPKGPTGKLQRIGLADKLGIDLSYQSEAQLNETADLAPRMGLEADLHKIWSEIFKRDISIADNFFALGGDSTMATAIIARYAQVLHLHISFLHFFEYPTVQKHARYFIIKALTSPSSRTPDYWAEQIDGLPESEAEIILESLN